MIHTRAADEETLAQLAAEADGVSVVMHCFSMPEHLRRVPGARLCDLVRRQRHLQERRRARRGGRRVPDERLLVETDAPYLTPQAVRKQRNQPAFVAHTAAFLAELRGVTLERARRDRRAQRGAPVRLGMSAVADASGPAQPAADAPVRRCAPTATSGRTS